LEILIPKSNIGNIDLNRKILENNASLFFSNDFFDSLDDFEKMSLLDDNNYTWNPFSLNLIKLK